MQSNITGTLIYAPGLYIPPAEIAAAALDAVAAQFPGGPIWIATHGSQHAEALQALLREAREIMTSAGSDGDSIQLLSGSGGLAPRLREVFALNAPSAPKADDAADASVAVCYGWYPLLDSALVEALLADHTTYLAHISYSENIPAGFAPDFVARDFVADLPDPLPPELSTTGPSPSGELRAFAFKNIDRFDVEIFYRAPDLRQHRLELSAADERSTRLIQAIRALRPELAFADLEELLRSNPEIVRPYPSYFEVELCSGFAEDAFAPHTAPPVNTSEAAERRTSARYLSSELLEKLRGDIAANGLRNDVTVSLAGRGEACRHPDFINIMNGFLELPAVKHVIIETYAAGVDSALLESIFAAPQAQRVVLIVRLDSLRPERYTRLYGADRFANVQKFLTACETALKRAAEQNSPAPAVYVEMHRLAETEDELSEFMDRFEDPEQPIRPLLQKFNRYIDRLPERRAADLTPLTRDFCWHLARDFFLTVDGRVPLCKQDPYGENTAALDFSQMTVAEIGDRTMPHHAASMRGEHDRVPMPCLQCDEWYTFNA
ncbi:MAG: spiro-SPASM protein [bacterium]|nr:spiro-SPASM protein [bacterium]